MTRQFVIKLIAATLALAFVSPGYAQPPVKYVIHDSHVRQMLHADHINVRQRNPSYMPAGPLPVLTLESVDDSLCKKRMDDLVRKYSRASDPFGGVHQMAGLYTAKSSASALWVDRGSGAYKYTNWQHSMSLPQVRIADASAAVELALVQVRQNKLITLSPGESLDVLFVSTVRGRTVTTANSEPRNLVTYDYYVGLGRLYEGVPVIGSRLVIRFDGNGNVAMVERRWRQIVRKSPETATPTRSPLREVLTRNLMEKEHYRDTSLSAGVTIDGEQCGYMEAPLGYTQSTLKPGCVVTFFVGKQRPEMLPQAIIPLEEGATLETLWGKKRPLLE